MTPRAAALGRDLFFDRRLSSDGTVSCSSCHRPEASFADTESVSAGVNGRTSSRNAPSLWNVAYAPNLFWDGRVETLEHQVLYPVTHPNEMNMRDRDVADLVAGDPRYASRFAKAFGTREVTFGHVSQAIAAYERTLVSGDAAFDAFYFCEEDEAISPAARRGWELFRTRGCIGCHQFDRRNPFFTDFDFHNTGVGWDRQTVDLGRYRLTRDRDDRGKFRTPSLRDVARTAPYMHDGRFRRLEEVLDFYNAGGFPNRYLDERIAPLGLTETEKADMVAFLRSLSHGTAPLAPSCNFGARNVEGEE